jgi:hypothetical protein
MDTEMEYLPINNIKQELEPTTSADANENSSNNNQAAPDSVENKVSEATPNYHYKKPHVKFYATSFRCRLKFRFPLRRPRNFDGVFSILFPSCYVQSSRQAIGPSLLHFIRQMFPHFRSQSLTLLGRGRRERQSQNKGKLMVCCCRMHCESFRLRWPLSLASREKETAADPHTVAGR